MIAEATYIKLKPLKARHIYLFSEIVYTVDSRYLEFDGTMEKIRVNRSSTQEEL